MFRNRMLGGVSFLPLFATEGGAGGADVDPAEVAEHGDPEFGEAPGGAEAAAGEAAAEDAEGAEGEPAGGEAAAAAAAADGAKAKTPEELQADLDAALKANKALTKRLGTVAGEKRQISEKLQQTLAAVPAKSATAETEAEQPDRADFKSKAEFDAAVAAEANRVAALRVAQQTFNAKCNDVEDKGSKAYGDKWKAAKQQLAILDDEGRIPIDLLTAALETDDPAEVLFKLGSDIDKAAEMMALTPTKRAIAMDRLAQKKPAAERQRSQTPPPIDPIGGRGGGSDAPSDKDSDAEWHRKEGLREAARRKQRLGIA